MTKISKKMNYTEELSTDSSQLFDGQENYLGITLDLETDKKEFEHSFEGIHDPGCDKYLVPIFADENMLDFGGNGVIVGNYLITAAHVTQSSSHKKFKNKRKNYSIIWFLFNNKLVRITNDDIIFDGRNMGDENGCHNDVNIYRLTGIVGDFVLNDNDLKISFEMATMPLKYYNGLKQNRGIEVCRIDSLVSKTIENDSLIVWHNCFDIIASHVFYPLDSGSPVFVHNVICGILIEVYINDERRGIVLDSRYIKRIIDNYEKNNLLI